MKPRDPLADLLKTKDYPILRKRYLKLKESGLSDALIAMRLGVSPRTLYAKIKNSTFG